MNRFFEKEILFLFFFSFVVRSFILGEKNVHWLVNVLDCLYKAKATIALRGVSYRCICHLESHRKHESTSNTEIQNNLNEQMFYWLTDLCELNIISKKNTFDIKIRLPITVAQWIVSISIWFFFFSHVQSLLSLIWDYYTLSLWVYDSYVYDSMHKLIIA